MLLSFKYSSAERRPRTAGSGPFSRLFSRTMRVTRPSSLVVTPYQEPIGSSVSQFVLTDQFSPSVEL